MRTDTEETRHRHSRRAVLRLAGGASAAVLLAACGGAATSGPATTSATTAATRGAAGSAAPAASAVTATGATAASAPGVGEIVIPNTGAKLPTAKVAFRWIDSGDLKALFYKKFFAAYQQAHPNITITYDALPWTEINKIVPLGVQNGNAHDVFAIPQNFTGAQAVREGWVAPLDDLIPNFAQWKQNFPFSSFIPGIHTFNDKTYTFPVTSNKRYGTLTLYNVEYLQKAGYDPASKPLTWDEFRAAAKKLTQQGSGKYYGIILAGKGNYFNGVVSNLARMAGAAASGGGSGTTDGINWKTGEYNYTADQYRAAIELLLALKSDGSVFPGSLSLNGPEARAQMPNGVAGLILEGPWNIPQWPQENPNFTFGVASQPIPNSGDPVPLTYEETGANQMWVYAKSPSKAIAGDMFAYTGSEDGQTAIVVATEGNLRAILPQANERAQRSQRLDPHASKALQLFDQQVRLGPMPVVRNPDVSQVNLEMKAITPTFNDTIQGLYTGQIGDVQRALQDLKDRSDKELDRAIKAAQAKGAKVSRDDYVFPNWDPTRDYTQADYDALRK